MLKKIVHVFIDAYICSKRIETWAEAQATREGASTVFCNMLSFQKSSSAFHAIKLIIVFPEETKRLIFKYVSYASNGRRGFRVST